MTIYSKDYKPVPADWKPPEWIPAAEKLEVDSSINQRVSDASKGKIFDLPDRLPTTYDYLGKSMISVLSGLAGLLGFGIGAVGPTLLLDKKDMTPSKVMMGIPFGYGFYTATSSLVEKLANTVFFPDTTIRPVAQGELDFLIDRALENPLFAKMWVEVSTYGELKVSLVDRSFFSAQGLGDLSDAQCRITFSEPIQLEIILRNDVTLKRMIVALIFELANLYQIQRFDSLERAAILGLVDREQYSLTKEYIEHNTDVLTQQTIDYGIHHMNWQWKAEFDSFKTLSRSDFSSAWTNSNIVYAESIPSHAEYYRMEWDQKYSQAFNERNQPSIQEKVSAA